MTTHKKSRTQHPHFDVDATISADTGIKTSVKQIAAIITSVVVVAFLFAVGYAFLIWGQQDTAKVVKEIKDAQVTAVAEIAKVTVTQDQKREALGKQFIESNEKIASSISQLTTLTAVQQERQKSTDEKLEKVLAQIGSALAGSPPRPR